MRIRTEGLTACPVFFSEDTVGKIRRIEEAYAGQDFAQVIYEVVLNDPVGTVDVSGRIDTAEDAAKNYWLEYDYGVYAGNGPLTPCVFLDASCLGPEKDEETAGIFYELDLPRLIGAEKAAALAPAVKGLVKKLSGKCPSLFQVGSMDSREPSDSVRIYTEDMSKENAAALLEELSWPGDTAAPYALTEELQSFTESGGFTVSFDLFCDHISEKIGVEFKPSLTDREEAEVFFKYLVRAGYCLPEKAEGLMAWITERFGENSSVINDISHIKFSIEQEKVISVKAYLRQTNGLLDQARSWKW